MVGAVCISRHSLSTENKTERCSLRDTFNGYVATSLLITLQWRHRNETRSWYSELNSLQNVYFGFFILWKLTEWRRFVTYLWNDPRNNNNRISTAPHGCIFRDATTVPSIDFQRSHVMQHCWSVKSWQAHRRSLNANKWSIAACSAAATIHTVPCKPPRSSFQLGGHCACQRCRSSCTIVRTFEVTAHVHDAGHRTPSLYQVWSSSVSSPSVDMVHCSPQH